MISIVLATYNGEKYIKEQLESIINQSFKDFEILILDDKSEDNTLEIIKDYEKKYDFIRVIQNKKRAGVIKNFEKGISLTNGDFISLSDQDDIWERDKLLMQYNAIKDYNIPAMVHSDLSIINEKGEKNCNSFFKKKGYFFPKKKSVDILISRSGVMGNTIMFNKKLKNLILPFYKEIPMHDYYIGVIAELYGKRITLNQKLVRYRIHSSNIGNKQKNLKEKITGFFKDNLPYQDRIEFLEYLLNKKDIIQDDKKEIEKFLKNIKSPTFKSIFLSNYYKNKISYKAKLFLRAILR